PDARTGTILLRAVAICADVHFFRNVPIHGLVDRSADAFDADAGRRTLPVRERAAALSQRDALAGFTLGGCASILHGRTSKTGDVREDFAVGNRFDDLCGHG